MARIAGINIPLNKRAEIGLTYIYGIGQSTSNKILRGAGVITGCRRCADVGCGEDFVESFDGGFDVVMFEDEGRQETEDGFAGAVDDDAALHHLGGYGFG